MTKRFCVNQEIHGTVAVLFAFLLVQAGCGMVGKSGGMTQAESLNAKIRCAEEGRRYEKGNEEVYAD